MRVPRLLLSILVAGACSPPPVAAPPPTPRTQPVSAACVAKSLDRLWGGRAEHRTLHIASGDLLEYLDSAITRRKLVAADAMPTMIRSGFAYQMEVVGDAGHLYWLRSVDDKERDASMVRVMTVAATGDGEPRAIPGQFPTPVKLFDAPDGVYVSTKLKLVHLARDGARTTAISDHVWYATATPEFLYVGLEYDVARRRHTGGDLEVLAKSQRQVRELAALGDRVVWEDSSEEILGNQPGTLTPVSYGTFDTELHLFASQQHIYLAAGNVIYVVLATTLKPVAKAQANVRAFAVAGHAIYALADKHGLARLCHDPTGPGLPPLPPPSDTLECPPNTTASWIRDQDHVCVDAHNSTVPVHRRFYASGELAEERLLDGSYRRLWADGTLAVEGTFDANDEKHGTWTEYLEDGAHVTRWDHGTDVTR
jgi:hypothetical protein